MPGPRAKRSFALRPSIRENLNGDLMMFNGGLTGVIKCPH